jgi:subtilase family serine protease
MRFPRDRFSVAALCAVSLAVAGAAGGVPAAAASGAGRTALVGTAFFDGSETDDGPATDLSEQTTARLWLSVRDPRQLAAEAKTVSDPNSPDYGHDESAAQVQAQNQLTPGQMAKVLGWLTSAGVQITQPGWRYVDVTGTLAQFSQLFDVKYDKFQISYPGSTGETGVGATTDLSVPGDVGALVQGELGADSIVDPTPDTPTSDALRELNAVTARDLQSNSASTSADETQCSQYWGQKLATGLPKSDGKVVPYGVCGYTPAQLRSAYGFDRTKLTGAGQTVAVVMPPPTTLEQDVDTWSTHVGTQPLRPGQLTVVGSPDGTGTPVPGFNPDTTEATLDVEAVHAIAPDADIIDIGLDPNSMASQADAYAYLDDQDRAGIVDTSAVLFAPPGQMATYEQEFQEGALEGIGFYFSSSDSGQLGWPASSSWATAVGGTALAIGPDGKREWETGWGDVQSKLSPDDSTWIQTDEGEGAGGGRVDGQTEPWYQRAVVPTAMATGPDGKADRVGPDVAMDADPGTGMLLGGHALDLLGDGANYVEHVVGGTSLSSPLFAAAQSLAQQASGRRLGFADPEIYQRYGTSAFRDVTAYTAPDGSYPDEAWTGFGASAPSLLVNRGQVLTTTYLPSPPATLPGYDEVTGVGVPTADYLRSFH